MPYVITTKRCNCDPVDEDYPHTDCPECVSRRAVATLEEAELRRVCGPEWERIGLDVDLALDMVMTAEDAMQPCALPDGTVIEVEQHRWAYLSNTVRLYDDRTDARRREILDAYNARQET